MPGALTYNVAGNREDLTDILSRISPEETPISSMIRTGKPAKNTFHEWQVDALDGQTTLGTIEGSDNASFANTGANRSRLGNYTQITRRNYLVSKTQQAVTTAGVPDERASAVAKKLIETKLDIEAVISSGNDRSAGSATTPRQTRGLFSWISSSGPSDVAAAYRTPAASIVSGSAAITEAQLNAVAQSIWTVGGKLEYFVVGPVLKRTLSGFVGRTASGAGINTDAAAKKIINTVSVYETDFGPISFVPSRLLNMTTTPGVATANTNDGIFLYGDAVEMSWLRPLAHEELDDDGGGSRGMVEGEYTLVVKNPLGLGKHENTA